MVIFGASGDLTRRKLIPAIFDLAREGRLPSPFSIVGVARTPMDHNGFRTHLLEAMKEFGQWREGDGLLWESFAKCLFYTPIDPAIGESYGSLRDTLHALDVDRGAL